MISSNAVGGGPVDGHIQELLAPRHVWFYSSTWENIDDKTALAHIMRLITGIPGGILRGASLSLYAVAQRMSWASGRETTRREDIAYCLIGLFDVQMAPIYGEGTQNAFLRLQEEILKRTADQTLFLWIPSHEPYNQGLLATSPQAFCRHRRCFDWVTSPRNLLFGEVFDPYAHFQPLVDMVGAQSLNINAEGKTTIIERKSQGSFAALGAHGVQGNFLIKKFTDSNSSVRMLCLDIEFTGSVGSIRIGLNLQQEAQWPPGRSPNRAGFMKRLCAVNAMSKPVFNIIDCEFQREAISVSQISTPDANDDMQFPYNYELHSGKSLPVFPIGFEREFKRNGKVMLQPSAHMLRHTCPDTRSDYDFVLCFGAHNTRPTFWCRVLTPALLQEYGYTLEELEKAYVDLKLSSGRFRREDVNELQCGAHGVVVSMLDHDVESHNVVSCIRISMYIYKKPTER